MCQRRADNVVSFTRGFSFTADASWFLAILLPPKSTELNQAADLTEK